MLIESLVKNAVQFKLTASASTNIFGAKEWYSLPQKYRGGVMYDGARASGIFHRRLVQRFCRMSFIGLYRGLAFETHHSQELEKT